MSISSVEEFLSALCKNNVFSAAMAGFMREWGNDYPATILFSTFGKTIADNFEGFMPDERMHLFLVVEDGMESSDIHLRTYIATGLLEALYSRSQSLENWDELSKLLGVASKRYVNEWTAL